MRIGLCQINPTLGDFNSNLARILEFYHAALERRADLVVFPEMAAIGYPPSDLLYEEEFISANLDIIQRLCRSVTVPLILGYVRRENGRLYNSAALIREGVQTAVYDKMLLPTYDVFDEDRYFENGTDPGIWTLDGPGGSVRIGIEICEDLWDADYPVKVSRLLRDQGADMIVNISASPYHEGRLQDRLGLITAKVHELQLPFFYCNLVGAQDELIFDGQSLALDGKGRVLGAGRAFQEDLIVVDLDNPQVVSPEIPMRESEIFNALSLGVRDYIHKVGYTEAVIGLSGGIDSALVTCIAATALGPQHVHAIAMPSRFSSAHSLVDARTLTANLGIDFRVIPIQEAVECFEQQLAVHFRGRDRDITEENNQARLRGNILMALSNKFGWLVLSCGNKTELALGYCTLYGDMVGGLSVISDLSKTDVYALAGWFNRNASRTIIPASILTKAPSAELRPDQVDPFDYDVVSPLVDALVEDLRSPRELVESGYDRELVQEIYKRIHVNEYKRRQAALGLRVSRKAFGSGRRIPIVNHFMPMQPEEEL